MNDKLPDPGPSPLAAGDPQVKVDEARAAIARAIGSTQPPDRTETLPLLQCAGRVLAADLICPIDVPAHDNSAMDGHAFGGAALDGDGILTLEVRGQRLAGDAALPTSIGPGQALRIMTGAVMPPGCDTVVPFELSRDLGNGRIAFDRAAVKRGENLRRRGEDLRAGAAALPAGKRLRAADLGLAASLGFTRLCVRARLRVALFSTGDEIVAPGEPLRDGCIYDSNRSTLAAVLQGWGFEVVDLGLVPDDPAALQAALERGTRQADAIVTSGGVSAGDADHTRAVLARLGEVGFWKVAMRPGRPFAFGSLQHAGRQAWLFALPGNPVAALVTLLALARDGLMQLAGALPEAVASLRVRSNAAIRKRPGRSEFQRGIVGPGADGRPEVRLTGAQGAGILRSLSLANALIVLPHDRGPVAAGEDVEVWWLDALMA